MLPLGKFKMPAGNTKSKPETMAEMAASLLKLEGEQIEVVPSTAAGKASVISDEDMEMLLDRRAEVFADRGLGWNSTSAKTEAAAADMAAGAVGEKQAAFAVYQPAVDEGHDALAKMMGEEIE
jgi:ATP-dependent DNA helicase